MIGSAHLRLDSTSLLCVVLAVIGIGPHAPVARAGGPIGSVQARTARPPRDPGGASVYGSVYQDWNQNRLRDPGEPGLAGAIVSLYDLRGLELARMVTVADGAYRLGNPGPGHYILALRPPEGYSSLQPRKAAIAVGPDQAVRIDFGVVLLLGGRPKVRVPDR